MHVCYCALHAVQTPRPVPITCRVVSPVTLMVYERLTCRTRARRRLPDPVRADVGLHRHTALLLRADSGPVHQPRSGGRLEHLPAVPRCAPPPSRGTPLLGYGLAAAIDRCLMRSIRQSRAAAAAAFHGLSPSSGGLPGGPPPSRASRQGQGICDAQVPRPGRRTQCHGVYGFQHSSHRSPRRVASTDRVAVLPRGSVEATDRLGPPRTVPRLASACGQLASAGGQYWQTVGVGLM